MLVKELIYTYLYMQIYEQTCKYMNIYIGSFYYHVFSKDPYVNYM